MKETFDDRCVDTIEAARILNSGVQTLNNARSLGTGPPYLKIGRSVRYRISDLADYMERHRIDPSARGRN